MPSRSSHSLRRGFCPACSHRLAAHDPLDGCLATASDEPCWCPMALTDSVRERVSEAWERGVKTALTFATRDDDGITLSLDRSEHPNPVIRPSVGGS